MLNLDAKTSLSSIKPLLLTAFSRLVATSEEGLSDSVEVLKNVTEDDVALYRGLSLRCG